MVNEYPVCSGQATAHSMAMPPICGTRLWIARDFRLGNPSRPITVQGFHDLLPVVYISGIVSHQEGNDDSDGLEAVRSKVGRWVTFDLAILLQQ